MEIRSVGGINPADHSNKPSKPIQSTTKSTPTSDSYRISEDARFLEDEAFVKEVLSRVSDIDQERVNSIKNKLDNDEYNNKETIDVLTEKLARVLGL